MLADVISYKTDAVLTSRKLGQLQVFKLFLQVFNRDHERFNHENDSTLHYFLVCLQDYVAYGHGGRILPGRGTLAV